MLVGINYYRTLRKINMRFIKLLISFLLIALTNCNSQNEKEKSDTNINPEIKAYADFLKNQNISAKNYVLSLFEKYDIVIISERLHYEYTQYELYLDIISDKQFIDSVGNIFVEVGVSSEQDKVEIFLKSEKLTEKIIEKKALEIYRNIPFLPSWDKTSYYDFLIQLYKINQDLEPSKKINLYYSDVPFNWKRTKTKEQYKIFMDTISTRDSIIAKQIIDKFEINNHKKALVILNYRHGFTNIRYVKGGEKAENTGRYLKEKYENRIASVLINDLCSKDDTFFSYQNGKWDATFKLLDKKNIGFDFNKSPFGNDSFDMYPIVNDLTYNDVFTGFIYTSPIDSFIFKKGVKNYISNDFKSEYLRRIEIGGYLPDIENDTIQRLWKYNNKEWCPNYDTIEFNINKWKTRYNNAHKAPGNNWLN